MSMQCEQAETRLAELASGEPLSGGEGDPALAEAAAHVESCDRCREKLADYRLTLKLLADGFAAEAEETGPVPTLSAERRARLEARFAAPAEVVRSGAPVDDPAIAGRFNIRNYLRPLGVAASFGLVAIGAWGLMNTMQGEPAFGPVAGYYFEAEDTAAEEPLATLIDATGTVLSNDDMASPGDFYETSRRKQAPNRPLENLNSYKSETAETPDNVELTLRHRNGLPADDAESHADMSIVTGKLESIGGERSNRGGELGVATESERLGRDADGDRGRGWDDKPTDLAAIDRFERPGQQAQQGQSESGPTNEFASRWSDRGGQGGAGGGGPASGETYKSIGGADGQAAAGPPAPKPEPEAANSRPATALAQRPQSTAAPQPTAPRTPAPPAKPTSRPAPAADPLPAETPAPVDAPVVTRGVAPVLPAEPEAPRRIDPATSQWVEVAPDATRIAGAGNKSRDKAKAPNFDNAPSFDLSEVDRDSVAPGAGANAPGRSGKAMVDGKYGGRLSGAPDDAITDARRGDDRSYSKESGTFGADPVDPAGAPMADRIEPARQAKLQNQVEKGKAADYDAGLKAPESKQVAGKDFAPGGDGAESAQKAEQREAQMRSQLSKAVDEKSDASGNFEGGNLRYREEMLKRAESEERTSEFRVKELADDVKAPKGETLTEGKLSLSDRERDVDQLLRSADKLDDLQDVNGSLAMIDEVLEAEPNNTKARELKKNLEGRRRQLQPLEEAAEDAESDALPAASNFKTMPVNPFVLTERDRFSTFGLDTDSASYALARKYVRAGFRPPAGAIRMEEFVNAFDYNYSSQSDRVFTVNAEAGDAPYGENLTLVKIGVKAKTIGRENRKPAHLVFVIDASGSMDRPDRLPLVKHSLSLLVKQLGPEDRVSIVAYGTKPILAAEATPASDARPLLEAIHNIQAGGSTNMVDALTTGYNVARNHFKPGEINRVIVCSDGVANVGSTDAEQMLAKVAANRAQGITLTNVGFGIGGYNDALMTDLAKKGDGNYVFVDTTAEAKRLFVDQLASTLQTVAKDAKIQVEFDPTRVRRYRLIGYERRDIADDDFRNDTVDAGEVGSGQSATALYEVELLPAAAAGNDVALADLGTVFVRYKNVETGEVEEISSRLRTDTIRDRTPDRDPRFYLAASAAEYAEVLRGSEFARSGSLDAIERRLVPVVQQLPLDRQAAELLDLVRRTKGLPAAP